MSTRSCSACRSKQSIQGLLRLRIDEDMLAPDTSPTTGGRGAWVCLRASCLRTMEKQPGRASGALKASITRSAELQSWARQALLDRIRRDLVSCSRSGLVCTRSKIESSPHTVSPVVTLRSQSPEGQNSRSEDHNEPGIEGFDLPWSEASLGEAVGQGPLSVVQLWPGRPSSRLIRHLYLLVEVG
jgi:predicted RNA-binding protein YlxR (DUF448 family)